MKDGRSCLYIMVGPPGSGKSTLAAAMAKVFDAVVVSPDAIRGELFGDEKCQDDNARVFDTAYERMRTAYYEGDDVILDATNVVKWRRMELVERFYLTFDVIVAVCYGRSLEECLFWNRQRDRQVPDHVIKRMFRQYREGGYPTLDEGFDMVVTFETVMQAIGVKPEQEPHGDIHVVERFVWAINLGVDNTRHVDRKILKAFDNISDARSFAEDDSRSYGLDMKWMNDGRYFGESPVKGLRYSLHTIPYE